MDHTERNVRGQIIEVKVLFDMNKTRSFVVKNNIQLDVSYTVLRRYYTSSVPMSCKIQDPPALLEGPDQCTMLSLVVEDRQHGTLKARIIRIETPAISPP